MDIAGLLTSAGINISICVVLLSLYSILRKQPSNMIVYFGRWITPGRAKHNEPFSFDRFMPSPSWVLKAWETTDEELLEIAGVDAVVFMRIIVFSIRIFSIAASICIFLVLPVNYYGQGQVPSRVQQNHITFVFHHGCPSKLIFGSGLIVLHYMSFLVRLVFYCTSETVQKFFTNYYASSYLSHQMVYRASKVQKLMSDAEKMYKMIKTVAVEPETIQCSTSFTPCMFCGGTSQSFKMVEETETDNSTTNLAAVELSEKIKNLEESPAAFVFFKTRFAALIAAQSLQSSNPMLWVTKLAPEPHDVYWSNLWIPYKQLWLRKIAILLASIAFVVVSLIPVAFVQALTHLDQLPRPFSYLRDNIKQKFIKQVVTGYLPSVLLILFLYAVPPTMMLFSKLEGPTSRSGRKKSACIKVLCFTILNVFFLNVLSGSLIQLVSVFSRVKDIPSQLAKAVPNQATFFMTYVLSSGWASLACEVIQLFALLCNMIKKFIFRMKDDSPDAVYSFPHHIEIPRVLLFGLIGFTCSVMAPLILPLLLGYYFLAYLVYRNQILNVYVSKYESGGRFWPIVHNTTIFSLVLTQIIALGVFGIKRSPIASGFTIPLIVLTFLFNEYCRQRFTPIFRSSAAQVLIEMDRQDEQSQRLEQICQQLQSAYCQFPIKCHDMSKSGHSHHRGGQDCIKDQKAQKSGKQPVEIN
ncbi:hypothetical protein SLEP1_g41982 [Rubroshorea leprosula]|uniref:CSC1-like protein RXW8 n=1 Tax=Rubroshorea leprosula TaxID=152421 RepID=A0AAV5L8R0_9ROSI|nr:hypothetical protein SLEP1_g41982 [Rubroshorea leprosula]